jgi:hypothetical protein
MGGNSVPFTSDDKVDLSGNLGRILRMSIYTLCVLIIGSISRVVEILQPFAKPTVLLDYSLEVR